tara:strand:+ start:1056 stop:1862 length:807 start_codon:yes stop_codon:yes gene_type:complete
MSEDLGGQVQNLTMQHMVTFWIIDFNPVIAFTPAPSGIMYVTSYKNGAAQITYGGNQYSYVGVKGSGFASEINGQLPEPTVVFDKASLVGLTQYKTIKAAFQTESGQQFFDWRGAKITRIKTTSNYLNNTSFGDTDSYLVDQVTSTTKSTLDIKLAVSTSADSINNLSVQELAPNRCALRYRTHNGSGFDYIDDDAGGCAYGNPTNNNDYSGVPDFGNLFFTEADASTGTASLDKCSYSVKGCQSRFDPDENGLPLPFLGLYKDVNNK